MDSIAKKNIPLKSKKHFPVKIIQFGEGNFLRAFIGDAIDQLNTKSNFRGSIAVVQPLAEGTIHHLRQQSGAYTLFLNGIHHDKIQEEKRLLNSISVTNNPYTDYRAFLKLARLDSIQFLVSNTTEAGISLHFEDTFSDKPPKSFPAKLTRWLWERFDYFNGSATSGLDILPCELIDNNAHELKKCILTLIMRWGLDDSFKDWILECNRFHNTLVDRIVPGYPKKNEAYYAEQLDYRDALMVVAEPYFLWVVESHGALKNELPFDQTNCKVKFVSHLRPYRLRKVRILNGAHTTMVPISIPYGKHTVGETMSDPFTSEFIQQTVRDEIIPTLPLDKKELLDYANAVFERFKNPFIEHQLQSIALNTISKFKVRVLPSIKAYYDQNGDYPPRLCFALGCLIRMYRGNWNHKTMPISDQPEVIAFFKTVWQQPNPMQVSKRVLANTLLWGEDLSKWPKLNGIIASVLTTLDANDIPTAFCVFRDLNNTINNE
ncbi:tagaturonate reductase [Flavobacteriaceae bacterium]|nr:tagaturonate reductase [Flavobacteriaceae bacterium]